MLTLIEDAAAAYEAAGVNGTREVAQALARFKKFTFTPSQSSLPALTFLSQALNANHRATFLDAWIYAELLKLPWHDAPERARPESLDGRLAFCALVGPEAAMPSRQIRFGLYLQAPATYYPPHSHAAAEHYIVLSGTALWQRGEGAFVSRRPGSYIFHESHESHAMETGREPLLAFWAWCGDLDRSTFRYDNWP